MEELEAYKKCYQKYMSQEPMMGPMPAGYTAHLLTIIGTSIFKPSLIILALPFFGFFSFLNKKGILPSELLRFLKIRVFGVTKAFVRHNNSV